jgi:pyrroline-5-carboxylate reductase
MNISFIGFGNMAKAIEKGLIGNSNINISAASPSLKNEVNDEGIITTADNKSIIELADVIILAVKPAQIATVAKDIGVLIKHQLVISVAAGVKLETLSQYNLNGPIVRAMPNIASAVGKGATPLLANALVSDEQKRHAEDIFNTIGITTWVEQEHLIDAFTALSGSGPAYIYLFIEEMIQAAQALGIDKQSAARFAQQTADGAIELAKQSKQDVESLRKQVTSPGGTTAAAINTFEEHDALHHLVNSAMKAAYERAQALGAQ